MSFVNTPDGTEIYYEDQGQGETLVFVSGFMGISDIWHNQVKELNSQYRCITHDNRGYGRSGKPENLDQYSVEIHAEDLKAILDGADVSGPVILITHSMGGNIATEFTLRYPEKVKGIVYTGTYLSGLQNSRLGVTAQALYEAVSTPSKSVEFYKAFGLTPSICLEAAKWANHTRLGNAHALEKYNPEERYSEIKTPVLIIQGDSDVVSPVDPCATELQAAIAGAQQKILENVNHFPQTEAPAKVTGLIKDFVQHVTA